MSKKQFISFLSIAITFLGLYSYFGIAQPIVSNSACADQAMKVVFADIPQLLDTKVNQEKLYWPPIGEVDTPTLERAQSLYDIHFNFCMNKRGWSGN